MLARIAIGDHPCGIVAAGGSVWVARAGIPLDLGHEPRGRPGAVWVSNTGSDTVSRVNPRTQRVASTIRVCDQPVNLDVVGGDVWVPCDGSNEVARIDAGTSKLVETIRADANTAVVVGAEGDVWVSTFDADTVWRIRPG